MTQNHSHLKSQKVYVMMSGGVDSSVAALDLKEQGYDVVGVFMKCWSIDRLTELGVDESLYGCFWEEDARDARLVAHALDIPFFVWDFEQEYKESVVDYMIAEYKIGRTPNPDVMCNSAIKFGIFYKRAMRLGADFVATGHYARSGSDRIGKQHYHLILRGKDYNKDQSYFLNRVLPSKVDKILFPIGEYNAKKEVRERAEMFGLITATKKDSQGLCFIGETPLRELLIQTIGVHEGPIIDLEGRVLGTHPGAALYTIGQRNKLGLAGGPWFVSKVDIHSNTVVVAHDSQKETLMGSSLQADTLNYFIQIEDLIEISQAGRLTAQIRYRQEPEKVTITTADEVNIKIMFDQPTKAISPGQSLVLYTGDAVVASGVIVQQDHLDSLQNISI